MVVIFWVMSQVGDNNRQSTNNNHKNSSKHQQQTIATNNCVCYFNSQQLTVSHVVAEPKLRAVLGSLCHLVGPVPLVSYDAFTTSRNAFEQPPTANTHVFDCLASITFYFQWLA